MKKFYNGDIWQLGEGELFASKDAMLEYVTDNWKEYSLPIGDEVELLSIDSENGITINFRYRDTEDEGQPENAWENESTYLDTKIVELTYLVSELTTA